MARRALAEPIDSLTATDNNAAAIKACQRNLATWGAKTTVIADDCGASLDAKQFDHIICNPPFHQGFDPNSTLTDWFMNQSAKLCKVDGQVWWVVNQFVGVNGIAQRSFNTREHVKRIDGFDIWKLKHPKA